MSFILLILKIIGYSILGLVIALVVLLTAILVLPIDYRVFYEQDEHTHIHVVSKLFYLVGINYKKDAHTNEIVIRLLGIPIKRIDFNTPTQEQEDNKKEQVTQTTEAMQTSIESEQTIPSKERTELKQSIESVQETSHNKAASKKERRTIPKEDKLTHAGKKPDTPSWKQQLETLWKSPYRKPSMKRLRQMLGQLCVYFKPHTLRFRVKIGQEDPAETGMLIAKLTMLYPFIYRYGSIEGMYEHQGVEGFVEVVGRMRLYRLIGIVLRFIIDKNVRSYIKTIMNIRKVKTNGI